MADHSVWIWPVLLALLTCSGFFSSAETALFALTPSEVVRMPTSVRRLLGKPRNLLVTVLLGNLVINLLFFSFAGRLLPGDGGKGDLAVGLGALVAVLVAGEILPKTLGLRARTGIASFSAPVLGLMVRLLGRPRQILIRVLERCSSVVTARISSEHALTAESLGHVLERRADEGLLLDVEADLLAEIIELSEVRVREVMTPRVDVLFVKQSGEDREAVVEEALRRRITWLPVIGSLPDEVVGCVHLRDMVRHPERPLSQMAMPVKFVPEVASALDLIETLREDRADEAVVVDEWGGTAGCVTLEDVFEEIVGDLLEEEEERPLVARPLGGGRFRVPGSLSIRDWNDAFGHGVVPREFETVGGFVTALVGKIPQVGDQAYWGGLAMVVHEMRGRRVHSVDIGIAHQDERTEGGVR